jgi:hypothetical protein
MGSPARVPAPTPEPVPDEGALVDVRAFDKAFARNFVLIFREELLAKFYGGPPVVVPPNRQRVKSERP